MSSRNDTLVNFNQIITLDIDTKWIRSIDCELYIVNPKGYKLVIINRL